MDWNKALVVASQCVVFVGLTVLVCLGKDSYITDALLAVAGSIAGTGLYSTLKVIKPKPPVV
jgi:activator of 2-hydroxyglutaryl-CoA dehydratase